MAGVSRETQMSIEESAMFPGFRFSPTDVELISYYLKKKMEGAEKCVEVIPEVEICKHEPWDLPGKSVIQSENEWFFFWARGRKYPNGSQSRRATELGYWKATGKERNVKSGTTVIGTKRTLVFHIGRAPKGERTEWIMHEYCMDGKSQDSLVVCRLRRNADFRGTDNSNRTAQSLRQLSLCDGGTDHQDKTTGCSKKSSSSYDSHSVGQLDSPSESEQQKLLNEAHLAANSSWQLPEVSLFAFDSDNEDFYADILKDDIIKLDETETSLSAADEGLPLMAPETPRAQKQAQPSAEVIRSHQVLPVQGTANRRIKWKMHAANYEEGEASSKDRKPSYVLGLVSPKMGRNKMVSLFFIILSLLVLWLLSFIGGYWHIKNRKFQGAQGLGRIR